MLTKLKNWEINEYENLLSTLSLMWLDCSNDQPVWSLINTWSFSVRSFYKYLAKYENTSTRFPFRQIWMSKSLPNLLSLHGRSVGGAFLILTNWWEWNRFWWTIAICVKALQRLVIMYYYDTRLPTSYGRWFTGYWKSIRWCWVS